MGWFSNFLTSSIGRKLIMSLTGLFLILFLLVHLTGNLQLLRDDGGEAFTAFTHFMETNPVIKIVAWGLYFFFIVHIVQGVILWWKNRKAKGKKYAVRSNADVSFASKNMIWLGALIFVFLVIHLLDFFVKLKVTHEITDHELYGVIVEAYHNPVLVGIYVVSMVILALHLWHGFQSAFQTLGLNHPKYTPFIKAVGKIYAIVVPLAFAIIPLYVYFFR